MAEWPRTITTAAMSGAAAGVLSAVAAGQFEQNRARNVAMAPRKNSHQWARGRQAAHELSPLRSTLPSIIVQQLISASGLALRERIFGRTARQQSISQQLLGGVTSAATAYVVNYVLTPKRSQPKLEKRSRSRGRLTTYAACGVGLALFGVMLSMKDRR